MWPDRATRSVTSSSSRLKRLLFRDAATPSKKAPIGGGVVKSIAKAKTARPPSMVSSATPKKPPSSSPAYTTPSKNLVRAAVVESWRKHGGGGGGCLFYLDGPDAEATHYFLRNGVDAKHLRPVNRDAKAADRIWRASGVRAMCRDIFDLFAGLRAEQVRPRHAAWLDLEQNDVSPEALAEVTRRCAFVHLTLSCRAEKPDAVIRRAGGRLEEAGMIADFKCAYRGRDGVHFMAHAVAWRFHSR